LSKRVLPRRIRFQSDLQLHGFRSSEWKQSFFWNFFFRKPAMDVRVFVLSWHSRMSQNGYITRTPHLPFGLQHTPTQRRKACLAQPLPNKREEAGHWASRKPHSHFQTNVPLHAPRRSEWMAKFGNESTRVLAMAYIVFRRLTPWVVPNTGETTNSECYIGDTPRNQIKRTSSMVTSFSSRKWTSGYIIVYTCFGYFFHLFNLW
jgi:hypothetical protein